MYHNKPMYQVSVEYVKGYGEKVGNTTGGMARRRANLKSPQVKPGGH